MKNITQCRVKELLRVLVSKNIVTVAAIGVLVTHTLLVGPYLYKWKQNKDNFRQAKTKEHIIIPIVKKILKSAVQM